MGSSSLLSSAVDFACSSEELSGELLETFGTADASSASVRNGSEIGEALLLVALFRRVVESGKFSYSINIRANKYQNGEVELTNFSWTDCRSFAIDWAEYSR